MKSYYRERLRIMKKYVKLGVLADEFGVSRTTISLFIKSSAYDFYINEDKLREFVNYCEKTLLNLT